MDDFSCSLKFENEVDEIRTIFSMDYIFNCFRDGSEIIYKNFFQKKKIKKLLEDKEILDSVEHFFLNNLNFTQTSKNSFVHRNTLIYRIEKIKNLTGLSIKDFNDAVIFNNILIVKKYIDKYF